MQTLNNTVHLLGIETSGLSSLIAISRGAEPLAHTTLNIRNIHSRLLAPMFRQLLKYSCLAPRDINGIALSAGPGSFTGLRIGYSLAKGLAHSLNIPIIEISTLDLWAFQAGDAGIPVAAVIDAHREELFCATYTRENAALKQIAPPALMAIRELKKVVAEPTLFTGGDLPKLKEKIRDTCGELARFPNPLPAEPSAAALLALAYPKFLAGEFSDLETCEPRYMRAFRGVM